MKNARQLVVVGLLVLALGFAPAAALAEDAAQIGPRVAQDGAQTPEQICDAAVQGLSEPETRTFEAPGDVLQQGVDYWAIFCTQAGPIYVDLFEGRAPVTVNSFVFLAQNDYYNNTTFHRVLPGFMAQGGDPSGTGGGDPGYEFADEIDPELTFDRGGLLAMANEGAGTNTNGSQFFITYAAADWLNGAHTIFGEVYAGLENAELLTPRDPQFEPAYEGDALNTVVIIEDPSQVAAEPDGPPSIDHFQALMNANLAMQLANAFVLDDAVSQARDIAGEAAYWEQRGGAALGEWMQTYLTEQGFIGGAHVALDLTECPASPEQVPFWSLNFSVLDFGTADAAQAVVADDARAQQLVDNGVFTEQVALEDAIGRLYSIPAPERCTGSGVLYRYEVPYGRYVLVVESILDGDVIFADGEVSPQQFMAFAMNELMLSTLGGPLERGNAAVAEAAPAE